MSPEVRESRMSGFRQEGGGGGGVEGGGDGVV